MSHATDGTLTHNPGGGGGMEPDLCGVLELTVDTNLEDTELTLASMGVVVVVSHGLNVVNGVTTTMMKKGKVGVSKAMSLSNIEPSDFPA